MVDLPPCPICATPAVAKYQATPYWVCPNCACWFQWPQPPKVWHAEHETPSVMSEEERQINRNLARSLYDQWLASKTYEQHTLDIGAALPVLAGAFHDLGCHAEAVDGSPVEGMGLPVPAQPIDFELGGFLLDYKYDLITMVHVFEHCYDPIAALRKLRALVVETGHVFIRSPDHDVSGFERDLTPGHFSIHPFYHCLDSILEALLLTQTFTVVQTYPLQPGQRDYVLAPL